MQTGDKGPGGRTGPLGLPPFRRFVLANLISATGSAMAPLALAYAVLGEGGDAGSLGLVLATNTVPTVVFLLVGGVLADRVARSRMLFLGNLGAGAAQGVLAALVASGAAGTGSIAACGFASGVAVAFTGPAAQGVPAQLVPAAQLQTANALVRLPSNAVKVLGPVVGGIVVAFSGPAWALGWDALTFVVAALLLLGLRLTARTTTTKVLGDLRAGWAGFRSRTWLWTYTLAGTVVIAAWLPGYQLLGPVVTEEHYGGARSWGLVQGAFALGLLAGTLVCLRWRPYRLLAAAVAGSVGLLLPLLAMGAGLSLGWVLTGALLAGVGTDVGIVAYSTSLQLHVPDDELGRLSAINGVGERVAMPAGYLVAGWAAGLWTDRTIMIVCAGVILVTTVANLCVRDVYNVTRAPELAKAA